MKQKILIGSGVLLLAVIAVQGFFLYRLSTRVDQAGHSSGSPQPAISSQTIDPAAPFGSKNWNPFKEMQRMQNEMDKMFGDIRSQFYQDPGFDDFNKSFSFSPSVDIKDEKNKLIVTADIPGSDESNINVKLEGDQLTISANTKKSSQQNGKGNMFRSERIMGQFQRTIQLPVPVLADKMKTDYKDGVLTITLPKA